MSIERELFLDTQRKKRRSIRLSRFLLFIFFIIFWQLGDTFGYINSFIFSSPLRVIRTIYTMAQSHELFYHIGITFLETIISFFLIFIIGIISAVLLWYFDTLYKILEPLLVLLGSLPKSALAPLFIVWLGSGMPTIIVAAVSVAVFGTILTLHDDFASMDPDKIKLILTLGGTKKDILFKLLLPGNVSSIISLMKVNIGLSLVGVIIGEFLASRSGLGYLIIYGSQVFKLDLVITSIIILCIMSIILYKIVEFVERKFA